MKTQTYQTRWNDDGMMAEHASATEALAHARALDTACRIYAPNGELWMRIPARIEDGRKVFPASPGTLAHWLQAHGRIAFVYGAARVVADDFAAHEPTCSVDYAHVCDDCQRFPNRCDHVCTCETARAALWQLADYRVSSVSGGSIWLTPK